MKEIVKAIMLSAPAILAGTALAVGGDANSATQPAVPPATQPSAQAVASNNSPLVIPDGTSGPVDQSEGYRSHMLLDIKSGIRG